MQNDEINDGGPAFPLLEPQEVGSVSRGMSLRDYVAVKALNGMLSNPNTKPEIYLVGMALEIADNYIHRISVSKNRVLRERDDMKEFLKGLCMSKGKIYANSTFYKKYEWIFEYITPTGIEIIIETE